MGLPKPSAISGEIDRGEAAIITVEDAVPESVKNSRALVACLEGVIRFDLGNLVPDDGLKAALLLRREADYLTTSMGPRRILRVDGTPTYQELIERTIAHLAETIPGLPESDIVNDLMGRESSFPSTLGHGIAVPHAYTSFVGERACAIAQVPEGVDFGARDGELVRLIFLLLSPPDDPEGHLETMAEIARMVSAEDVRKKLLEAGTSEDLWDIISRFPSSRDV